MASAVDALCPHSGTLPYNQQLMASAVAALNPPSGTVPYNRQLMASAVAALKPPSGTVPYNIVISCFLGARLQTSIGPDSWCSLSVGGCSSVVTCVASWGFVVNSSGKDAEKVMQ